MDNCQDVRPSAQEPSPNLSKTGAKSSASCRYINNWFRNRPKPIVGRIFGYHGSNLNAEDAPEPHPNPFQTGAKSNASFQNTYNWFRNRPGEIVGRIFGEHGSNLNAQEASKSIPKAQKSMLKNNKMSASILIGLGLSSGRVLGWIFVTKNIRKMQNNDFHANLKNSGFSSGKIHILKKSTIQKKD